MYRPRSRSPIPKYVIVQLLFFSVVFLSGFFITHYLQTHFAVENKKQFSLLVEELNHLTPFQSEIFFYCLCKQLKYVFFLCFFSITNIWQWFQKCFIGYIALSQSILLSLCYHTNGFLGIPEYLLFLFPECLVFIPLYLYLLYHLQLFHEACSHTANPQTLFSFFFDNEKKRILKRELPFLLCLIPLLMLGVALEVYVGLPILQAFHRHL